MKSDEFSGKMLDCLLYTSKRSRKAAIILEDCRYECECTFENLVEELQPYDFAVNHRGCLVNLRHIEKIQGFHIYLDNGKELSLSLIHI